MNWYILKCERKEWKDEDEGYRKYLEKNILNNIWGLKVNGLWMLFKRKRKVKIIK